jgi:two-component system CheB/CheR fusion protein
MAQYAPAYIVFDGQHEILRFSGPVAKYMEPVSGGASLNLFRMLHSQLRPPVRNLVRKVLEEHRSFQERVTFHDAGRAHTVNLIAEPMTEPVGGRRCLLLAFQELTPNGSSSELESPDPGVPSVDPEHSELIAAQEKLQTISEELETANEELQSSNEEFQSVNEELHSTVEELETSKEELQSINEELQTVNAELSNRADSLVRSNSDLANLFDSTSIATLFLDNKSQIRRFTPAITEIFNVREGDEGRPISDFSSRLAGSALTQDIQTVLRDLGSLESEVESDDGAVTYLVRVKPYRDLNNVIDGVVITIIDISDHKELERDQAHLAAIVASSEDAIISHDLEGTITSWNVGAKKIYGYTASEMIGQPMSTLLDDVQIDEWPQNLARLREGKPVTDIDISRVTKGHRVVNVSLTISPMRDGKGVIIGASAVARDISSRKLAEERANMLMAELDHRVKNILSVVSSVVTQTLKESESNKTARAEIEGRIQAIARAHSLLTERGGVEGSLRELVDNELRPYKRNANVTISGDDIVLTSRANLSIALAIHELATNAAKYGALSTSEGHLDVTWQIKGASHNPELEISWQEAEGPVVTPPIRRGFGTKLIERSLVIGLSAKVNREFLETGVRCVISVPLTPDIGRIRTADS